MGNVNMEAYQIHDKEHGTVAEHLRALDLEVEKAAVLPDMPTTEGKTVLTAVTDDQGDTELTYEAPEVEGEDIAPAFSEEVTYPAGTLVYYEGGLYKFTEDHAAGTWDSSEVTQTSAAAEFVETNSAVDELKNTLTETNYGQLNTNKAKLLLTKKSGIAFLKIENLSSIIAGDNLIEGIIPAGYRPSGSFKTCLVQRDSSYQRLVELVVLSSGAVDIYNYGSAITEITPFSGTLSYPIA